MSQPSTSAQEPQLPIPVYIPPGKTADMSKWNNADLLRWMTYFMHASKYPKAFQEFRKIPIDGDVLTIMVRFRPHHETFKISKEELDMILAHAEAVMDSTTKTPAVKEEIIDDGF